jgi:hypothetical protein
LRTLFVGVTALCVLLAQSPFVEWEPPVKLTLAGGYTWGGRVHGTEETVDDPPGFYYVPTRVAVVVSLEAAALIGWMVGHWLRRRWAVPPNG